MTFLSAGSKALLILEMMLFLNMPPQLLVLHLYLHWISWSQSALFYFAESQWFLGWSSIASFCFGRSSPELLFLPIRLLFPLSFPVSSLCNWYQGSGLFPGYPVLTGTSSWTRNGLFDCSGTATKNGVPASEAVPFLAGTWIHTKAVSELPVHETSIPLPIRFFMLPFSVDKAKLMEMYCICRLNNNILHFKYTTFILKRKHLWCECMQCLCKRVMRRWGKCCTVLCNYNPEVSIEIFSRSWRVCKFPLNVPETFLWPLPRPHYKV